MSEQKPVVLVIEDEAHMRDGSEVTRRVREERGSHPGDLGARPFGAAELMARIRLALRKTSTGQRLPADVVHVGDVHMTALRHKIEREPARPQHLITETGVGYRLRLESRRRRG